MAGHISRATRRRVAAVARFRCGYCLTSQAVIGPLLEIDHLLPEALGGGSEETNLWLACPHCNGAKGSRTTGRDALTGDILPLFNPRQDQWSDHF